METRRNLKMVAAVCALLVGLCAAAPARIIYVDDDAAGANDGSSWADASLYLQDALASASAGDEIRVAQGIYRPDQGTGLSLGNRELTFHIVRGIILRGGYAGVGATDPNARNVELYQTILSGDCDGDDPNVQHADVLAYLPDRANNSFHVVVIERVDSCVLDGFIIRDGQAPDGGGGLQIRGSDATLWNCTFTQNWGPKGGAIYIPRAVGGVLSNVGVHNCKFTLNAAAEEGGALCTEDGIRYISGREENGSLLLTDCEFVANTAATGGAVSNNLAAVSLLDCTFRANYAGDGGGLHQGYGPLDVTRCTFVENLALPRWAENSARARRSASTGRGRGGAVFVDLLSGDQVTLADCPFRNNRARVGAAIQGRTKELRRCRFTGNVAYEHSGAVDCSGTLIGENCLFDGNQSLISIGAVDCYGAQFMNCTFADNRSPDGNAFRSLAGHGTVWSNVFTNCIVWGTGHGLDPNQPWLAKTSVTYCDVEGGYPGAGNINLNPQWADPGHWDPNGTNDPSDDFWVEGDYHLKSRAGRWDQVARIWVQDEVPSPCIDAGDPDSPVGAEPEPNGGRIDMGAYGGTAEASKSYLGEQ